MSSVFNETELKVIIIALLFYLHGFVNHTLNDKYTDVQMWLSTIYAYFALFSIRIMQTLLSGSLIFLFLSTAQAQGISCGGVMIQFNPKPS